MPTKRLIASVDPEEVSASYGRGVFHFGAKVTEGYTNVTGKDIDVQVPAEELWDLVKTFARLKAQVNPGTSESEYEATRHGADWLRFLADELDADAEAMPPWKGKRVTFGTPELLEQANRGAKEDEAKEDEDTYKIVRFYKREGYAPNVIETGLTLEEAQAHCRREDTHGEGWFDGYEQEA